MISITIDHMQARERSNMGNLYVLTAVCSFSKYAVATPVATKGLESVKLLLSQLKSSFPTIATIRSDQAFESSALRSHLENLGVTLVTGCAHNSLQNPCERAHRTIRDLWRKFGETERYDVGNWEPSLQKAVEAYNSTPNTITQVSPFKLIFGYTKSIGGLVTADNRVQLRKLVKKRIEAAKSKYACEDLEKIRKVDVGSVVRVRYDPKAEPFFGEVVEDTGLSLTLRRKQGKVGQLVRVHKRHCFEKIKNIESPLWQM